MSLINWNKKKGGTTRSLRGYKREAAQNRAGRIPGTFEKREEKEQQNLGFER